MQFSQKVCVFGMVLISIITLGMLALAWFEKPIPSEPVVAIITTFGGFATCGYYALSGTRDWSYNKFVNNKEDINT